MSLVADSRAEDLIEWQDLYQRAKRLSLRSEA